MGRRSTLRASDADREQVAERLRNATAEGRLLAEELEQRLGAVFAARTYGELDEIVADLPTRDMPQRVRARPMSRLRQVPAPALIILIPVAISIAIAAVVVVVTVFAVWALLITIAWLALGHRRPPYYMMPRHYRRSTYHAYGRWRA